MVICLERDADLHMAQLCHCHSLFLASVKSRLVLPFWYRLTRVVPEKGSLNVCVRVWKSIVLSSSQPSEWWTLYRKHIKQLEQFHMRCLRKIAGIRWQDRVSNTRVLEMCGISGMESFLLQSQFRWVGHIVRMPDFRIPKQAFFGQLASGCRLQGGPV